MKQNIKDFFRLNSNRNYHFIFMMIISFVLMIFNYIIQTPVVSSIVNSFIVCCVIACSLEFKDVCYHSTVNFSFKNLKKMNWKDNFDLIDIAATIIGGIFGIIISLIFVG